MKTLLFKIRHFIAEENRFGYRTWAEMPSNILLTGTYLERAGLDIDIRDDHYYDDDVFKDFDIAATWASVADGLYESLDYLRVAKQQGLKTVLLLFDDWDDLSRQIVEDHSFIDFAVRRWDVEVTLERLIKSLINGNEPERRGLVYRVDNTVIDGGERIHFADNLAHLTSSRHWIERVNPKGYDEYSIRVGSGCPFKCTFCHIGRRPNRYRSIVEVADELQCLPENAFVRILSADLPADKEWTTEFCGELIRRKIKICWETDSRFSWLGDVDYLKLMRKSGCVELAMGLESYAPELLKKYKKGYRHELIEQGIDNLIKVGITPAINMMIGAPEESEHTLKTTEEFLLSADPNKIKLLGIQFLRPLPGTAIFTESVKEGLFDANYSYRDFYSSRDGALMGTKHLNVGEVELWQKKLGEAYFSS